MAEQSENYSLPKESIEIARNSNIEKKAMKHYEEVLAQLRKERQLEK